MSFPLSSRVAEQGQQYCCYAPHSIQSTGSESEEKFEEEDTAKLKPAHVLLTGRHFMAEAAELSSSLSAGIQYSISSMNSAKRRR